MEASHFQEKPGAKSPAVRPTLLSAPHAHRDRTATGVWDWYRISKIRARESTRICLLYNCISLLLGLGEACEHQVVRKKLPQSQTSRPRPPIYVC